MRARKTFPTSLPHQRLLLLTARRLEPLTVILCLWYANHWLHHHVAKESPLSCVEDHIVHYSAFPRLIYWQNQRLLSFSAARAPSLQCFDCCIFKAALFPRHCRDVLFAYLLTWMRFGTLSDILHHHGMLCPQDDNCLSHQYLLKFEMF